jgi:DNA repair exonuclease SbcCD nuclease subunit
MLNIIVIGDTHFKVNNIPEVELYIKKVTKIVEQKNPDIIVLLGDILDTFEKVNVLPLNKAYEFVDKLRKISKTYILVGNHDMINCIQFLTENHWMNALKEYNSVVIVDKVIKEIINDQKIIFSPYVFPGRFIEALNTVAEWEDASCIFAHQEFRGAQMGAFVSADGDEWPLEYPNVISGHIHLNQRHQQNIYYPGSSCQVAFGENQKNIIANITIEKDKKDYFVEEIDLQLPKKKIIYMNMFEAENYEFEKTDDKIKLSINATHSEFKTFKKTKKYRDILNNGIKIVFKQKKSDTKINNEKLSGIIENNLDNLGDFQKIIFEIIEQENDPYLSKVYNLIITST